MSNVIILAEEREKRRPLPPILKFYAGWFCLSAAFGTAFYALWTGGQHGSPLN